ncbi:MAG: acyl-CoA dehydrogenase N-terminal domain-containing protein [Burkholderiaceae bacterium]
MLSYTPPLRDFQFVIEEVLDLPARWAAMPAFAEVDTDISRAVLEEAGRFAAGVLAPLNASGDLEGCTLDNGEVRTPAGYPGAYQAFVDGGWGALACDPADGGQGLPEALNVALNEMMAAANHGWVMYPGCSMVPTHASRRTPARNSGSAICRGWQAANGWPP